MRKTNVKDFTAQVKMKGQNRYNGRKFDDIPPERLMCRCIYVPLLKK